MFIFVQIFYMKKLFYLFSLIIQFSFIQQIYAQQYFSENYGLVTLSTPTYFSQTISPIVKDGQQYYHVIERYKKDNILKLEGTIRHQNLPYAFIGTIKTYYPSGQLESVKRYDHKSRIIDKAYQYYPSGQLESIKQYDHKSRMIDTAYQYYPSGRTQMIRYFPQTETDSTVKYIAYFDSLGNKTLDQGTGFIEFGTPDENFKSGKMIEHLQEGEWTGKRRLLDNKIGTFKELYRKGEFIEGTLTKENGELYHYDSTNRDVQPTYPGGVEKFMKLVTKNYSYSKEALKNKVAGIVEISFVVDKNGDLTDFNIIQDLGYGTGEEAIRVIKKSKRWTPGLQGGAPVRVGFSLPLRLSASK